MQRNRVLRMDRTKTQTTIPPYVDLEYSLTRRQSNYPGYVKKEPDS